MSSLNNNQATNPEKRDSPRGTFIELALIPQHVMISAILRLTPQCALALVQFIRVHY